METALFIVAVLAAGLVCPAMMWWNRRQGRDAACCPPTRREETPTLEELYRRRDELARAIETKAREAGQAEAGPRTPVG